LDLAFTAFAARLALLMACGDETGIGSLAREFVRANTGGAEPELVDELIGSARAMVVAFERQDPGLLESVLRAHERDVLRDITGQLDDDD
jgi:hypothetical protein